MTTRALYICVVLLMLGSTTHGEVNGSLPMVTRDLKDAARTVVTLTADAVTPASSDTLVTVTKLVGDTSTASVTTYPVTSGKTLRLQSLQISFTSSTTTANKVRVRLRTLSSGTCLANSTLVDSWEVSLPTGTLAANQGQNSVSVSWPDGLEFSGSTRNICFSAIAAAANGVVTLSLTGYEY
jgi:hypothetical protein